jgi:two-component system sensor histidine kinase GlrK
MAGYAALMLLAAAMSVYAIMQLGKVDHFTHSILLIDNQLLDIHKSLTDALLSETRFEKKFLILRDRAIAESLQSARAEFEGHLLAAKKVGASGEIRKVVEAVEGLHGRYWRLLSEELAEVGSGRPYQHEWFAAEKEKAVSDVLDMLLQIRLLSQESIFHKVSDLRASGDRARKAAILMSVLSLVLGVVLAILITRSITRPLQVMRKKTGEIAVGVFTSDLKVCSPPEIGDLASAFNVMCDKLRDVDRMKSDFYALMSHELRTPLASIQEGTNLLLEGLGGEIADRQRRLLTILAEESKRLIELVSSLLDLSKLEAGMVAYQFAPTDLQPLLDRAVSEVLPLAEAKRIGIELHGQGLEPVRMDGERILQVMRNLLGNALKFTPPGGTIGISARTAEGKVVVTVADTGPGIPKQHLTAIFDKYRQSIQPRTGTLQGTGLGLAIVKHVIQAHGGTVWAESEPGQGSVFTFVLPG